VGLNCCLEETEVFWEYDFLLIYILLSVRTIRFCNSHKLRTLSFYTEWEFLDSSAQRKLYLFCRVSGGKSTNRIWLSKAVLEGKTRNILPPFQSFTLSYKSLKVYIFAAALTAAPVPGDYPAPKLEVEK
jgi:hypothetical protein